ncbi:MAG: low molecular weight phosphotyrosine protein phosphatase [Bifidobacteriaceae bacterium]|jgi:protein-tyrosine phosphatase|nr:low molecular weight phosphotyrosine protein phosphatase [Bifidobacteriaceae bacterium]
MPSPQFTIQPVCHGNICRSPMAAAVLRHLLDDAGLGPRVLVASSGVSSEERGNPIDRRAVRALSRRGHPVDRTHRAHRITEEEIAVTDLILPATWDQRVTLLRRGAGEGRVKLLRQFDPALADRAASARLDLADPWWGGEADFEAVLDQIEAAAPAVVEYVRDRI